VISTVVAAKILPREPVHDGGPISRADRIAGMKALLADRTFMLAVFATGLIQAAHAFYYAFGTLAWTAQGLSKGVIGLLWAFGVGVEVIFLWFMGPWRRRMGPWRLLILGGATATVRWGVMAFAPPLWLLWPLQTLHAFTFAATFAATLQVIEKLSPPRFLSSAQMLSSAVSTGVLIGAATLSSGALFDHFGAGGYALMSVMALGGLVGAWRLKSVLADA
jgi:PPP family 3-phenylpropionic acid transporter